MNYLLMPFDQHFDLGFGAVANSFKYAGDAVLSPQPLKAFLVVNENEEVIKAFQHDDELAQSMTDTPPKSG